VVHKSNEEAKEANELVRQSNEEAKQVNKAIALTIWVRS
jgi:hypothetical protein